MPRCTQTQTRRFVLVAALALSLASACAPSKFDGLSGGQRKEDGDDPNLVEEEGGTDEDAPDSATDDARDPDAPDEPGMDAGSDASSAGATDASDAEAGTGACMNSTTARPLRAAASAIELARLRLPAGVLTRSLGPTVAFATSRTWTFDHLRLSSPGTRPADRPANFPSSARDGATTPWTATTPTSDWQLSDNLDAQRVPICHLTLNSAEQANNLADYTALLISALLRDPAQANAAIGFAKKSMGIFVPYSEAWLVNLTSAGTVATRGTAPLFQAPEPIFGDAAVRDGTFFKLFACSAGPAGAPKDAAYPCTVARVPTARVAERAAYEFYARDTFGAGFWSSDVTRAAPVVSATGTALSVSFNEYLHQFLMVYSEPDTSSAALRSAPTPEGPWSEPLLVKQKGGPYWGNLNTREQESLAQNCGKRVIITSLEPQDGAPLPDGGVTLPSIGEVVLSAIDLQ